MLNVAPRHFFFRFIIFVLGLSLIAMGVKPFLRHDLFYTNWFGGLFFAPLAILAGDGWSIRHRRCPVTFRSVILCASVSLWFNSL